MSDVRINDVTAEVCRPADANLYEYAVIRYVPRIEREEFMNVGLIMMCKRRRWLKAQLEIDESRIKALCPLADVELLRRQAQLFTHRDVPAHHRIPASRLTRLRKPLPASSPNLCFNYIPEPGVICVDR